MEEHRPKRRKVERTEGLKIGEYNLKASRDRVESLGDKREIIDMPKLVLPAPADGQRVQRLQQSAKSSQELPWKIHARHLFPTQANSPAQTAADSASTVLAIAIVDGQGVVSEMDVPMASKSVWASGYGELTMVNGATFPTVTMTNGATFSTVTAPETKPSNTGFNPAAVTPPPAVAASQARGQALQTQEAIAKQLNIVPQAPASVASTPSSAAPVPSVAPLPSSGEAAQHTSISQASMILNVPGSHSQQVFSSPSTPVPATPQSAASSSVSYFSSLPALSPNSASSHTTDSPIITQISATHNPQLPTNNNFTVSSTTPLSSTVTTSATSSTSLSLSSLSSGTSGVTSSVLLQSAASQASSSSVDSLAALASATRNTSGFATTTRNSQTLSTGLSSTQIISTSTTLASSASASSQFLSQSGSVSSLSGAASSTGFGVSSVGGSGNTAPATATVPSPTSSSGGGSGGSNAPPTPVLVGGIVGGVAGAAMILLILLLLFRWRRGKIAQRRNISPPIPQTLGPGDAPQAGNMTQRSSSTPITAAGFLGRLRPTSAQTATTSDTAPSERGFQKISGRKLPSVLAAGGDGYGDASAGVAASSSTAVAAGGVAARAAGTTDAAAGSSSWATASSSTEPAGPASRGRGVTPSQGQFVGMAPALRPSSPHSLSGSSFYRDSHGFYGGVVPEETTRDENDASSSPSTSPSYPAPLNLTGVGSSSNSLPHNRPGPARTPVINEPATIPIRTPSRARQQIPRPGQATPLPQNPSRDGLGRSHPSQDGSRGSRFREDTTPP